MVSSSVQGMRVGMLSMDVLQRRKEEAERRGSAMVGVLVENGRWLISH